MKKIFSVCIHLLLITFMITIIGTSPLPAQLIRLSPHEAIGTFIHDNLFSIVYGRPYTKDPRTGEVRKIWGGLVPYGKVWRMGADEATMFFTQKSITIGGVTIPAGGYSLFTVPAEDGTARLIINKHLGQWGLSYYAKEDLVWLDMKKKVLEKPVDQFTIAIEEIPDGGVLKLMWEKIEYSVEFTILK